MSVKNTRVSLSSPNKRKQQLQMSESKSDLALLFDCLSYLIINNF